SCTPTSPVLLTYMPPSGTAVAIHVNYTTANIQTNFACGVAPYTATGVSLVSSITMPDGSSYSFTYEPNGSNTTGRLKQVTLPTGGTITYTYGGISCSDGSVTQLTRTLSSGGQWTYTRTQISGNHWQTKVTSPPDPTV